MSFIFCKSKTLKQRLSAMNSRVINNNVLEDCVTPATVLFERLLFHIFEIQQLVMHFHNTTD